MALPSFKAQVEFFVCRMTGVISKSPSGTKHSVTHGEGRGTNRWLERKTSMLIFCHLGLAHFPVMFSLLTLWFPTLCSQGRPLECSHQRRLPENWRCDAEEHSGHEGELLGDLGEGAPQGKRCWGCRRPCLWSLPVNMWPDSSLHVAQPRGKLFRLL